MHLKAGHNCRKIARARRLVVRVDGESRFAASRSALVVAGRRACVPGRSIQSRLGLVRLFFVVGLTLAAERLIARVDGRRSAE
jgi:hypothetical protein